MNTEPLSNLFKQCSAIARAGALDALKARAITGGLVTVVCAWCWAFIEDKPGAGVSGISHGICAACLEEQQKEAARVEARRLEELR